MFIVGYSHCWDAIKLIPQNGWFLVWFRVQWAYNIRSLTTKMVMEKCWAHGISTKLQGSMRVLFGVIELYLGIVLALELLMTGYF